MNIHCTQHTNTVRTSPGSTCTLVQERAETALLVGQTGWISTLFRMMPHARPSLLSPCSVDCDYIHRHTCTGVAIKAETKALKGTVKQLQSSCALLKSCLNPTHAPFYFTFSNVKHYYARRS